MVAHDGSRRIHVVGAFPTKCVTSVVVRSPSAMRYPTRALARSPSYPSRPEWCCSLLPIQDRCRGGAPVHDLHIPHAPTDLLPCRNYLKGGGVPLSWDQGPNLVGQSSAKRVLLTPLRTLHPANGGQPRARKTA